MYDISEEEQDMKKLYTVLILPHLELLHGPNLKHIAYRCSRSILTHPALDVSYFTVKSTENFTPHGVQLWDINANKIRASGPSD